MANHRTLAVDAYDSVNIIYKDLIAHDKLPS